MLSYQGKQGYLCYSWRYFTVPLPSLEGEGVKEFIKLALKVIFFCPRALGQFREENHQFRSRFFHLPLNRLFFRSSLSVILIIF